MVILCEVKRNLKKRAVQGGLGQDSGKQADQRGKTDKYRRMKVLQMDGLMQKNKAHIDRIDI